jgi:hypothetical protein
MKLFARTAAMLLLVSLGVPAAVVLGGSASAAVKPAGGLVHIYEIVPSLSSTFATDVFTGAITDHGRDYEGVSGHGTINKIALSKGSFEISIVSLASKPQPPVDPKTCSVASSVTASVPIVKERAGALTPALAARSRSPSPKRSSCPS